MIIELPKSIVEQELIRAREHYSNAHKAKGQTSDIDAPTQAELVRQAERTVRQHIILEHLIEAYKIEPNEEKMKTLAAEVISQYQGNSEVMQQLVKDQNFLANIRNTVMEEDVFDKLLDEINIEDKKMSLDELMAQSMVG